MKNTNSLNQLANSRNKFIVVVKDETYMWREDIAKKAGKIEGVYLVEMIPTHCCELAVSYYAIFLRNFFHKTKRFTEDELIELDHDDGGVTHCYFSGSSVMQVVKEYEEGDMDDIEEYERCNPSYC